MTQFYTFETDEGVGYWFKGCDAQFEPADLPSPDRFLIALPWRGEVTTDWERIKPNYVHHLWSEAHMSRFSFFRLPEPIEETEKTLFPYIHQQLAGMWHNNTHLRFGGQFLLWRDEGQTILGVAGGQTDQTAIRNLMAEAIKIAFGVVYSADVEWSARWANFFETMRCRRVRAALQDHIVESGVETGARRI